MSRNHLIIASFYGRRSPHRNLISIKLAKRGRVHAGRAYTEILSCIKNFIEIERVYRMQLGRQPRDVGLFGLDSRRFHDFAPSLELAFKVRLEFLRAASLNVEREIGKPGAYVRRVHRIYDRFMKSP